MENQGLLGMRINELPTAVDLKIFLIPIIFLVIRIWSMLRYFISLGRPHPNPVLSDFEDLFLALEVVRSTHNHTVQRN